jgi:Flp pilus assembly pilin Flp
MELMMIQITKFLSEESGLELAEYVIAAALIGLAVVAAFTNLGSSITDTINALIALIISG